MSPTSPATPPEEPWEREIHDLLSSLPPVDPPDGFLQRAIDHRPKYAARMSAAAVATVVGVTLAVVGFGLVGDPTPVAPPVGSLTERHAQAAAGFGATALADQAPLFEPVADPDGRELLELPVPFELEAALRHGEVVQLLYTDGAELVSVFLQRGAVQWDQLPAGGRQRAGERPVWVDRRDPTVVFEAGGFVVCVVGMDVDRALELLRQAPEDPVTLTDRLGALAREVARQAGFP